MKTLFETTVGSHAWNMQRPDSDKDTFRVYIVPTKDIHYWMNGIDEAYEESRLPENPYPKEFREFLYKLRIRELEGKL